MGSDLRDCVVTMLDLIDVKKRAPESHGSMMMRAFHKTALDALAQYAPSVHNAYVWNDSLLLLTYVDASTSSVEVALREADKLKRRIDEQSRCLSRLSPEIARASACCRANSGRTWLRRCPGSRPPAPRRRIVADDRE